MDLRVIGAAAVLVSTTVIGYCLAQRYRERPDQLRDVINSLQLLATEVSFGLFPLPEAFLSVAGRTKPPASQLYRRAGQLMSKGFSTQQAWSQAVWELQKATCLTSQDTAVLARLGTALGRSDRQDQIRHLQYTVEQVRRLEEEALKDRDRKAKLWFYLGWGTGVCTVILLY